MLAIPFATITMVMSTSFLTVLNVAYSVAWPVLVALTIDTLVTLMYFILLFTVLWAKKPSMPKEKFQFANFSEAKSSKYFTVPYIQAAIALPLAYFVLTRLPVAGSVQAAVNVIAILIGVHLSTFIGLYSFMRHSIRIPVAWKSIAKYVLASFFMGALCFFCFPLPQHCFLQ